MVTQLKIGNPGRIGAFRQRRRVWVASGTDAARKPANTAVPVITGTGTVGQTLSASRGTWAPPAVRFAYQWKRGGVAIAGAESSTYLLVPADSGTNVTVTVTASNISGEASATSANKAVA
jgi:hypothetical protein